MAKQRKRRNIGLGNRKKSHRPGQSYRFERVAGAGRVQNPQHAVSGHPSYITGAYAGSKLLPCGATVHEIVANPGTFIQSRLGKESEQNDAQEVDLTTTDEDNACSTTAGSCLSHRSVEKLKDAIAFFYINVFNCPPEEEWGGRNGVAHKICTALKLEGKPKRKFVKNVMRDVADHVDRGEAYSSKKRYSSWGEDKILIPSTSDEYQIIGNSMEDGHGLIATTELVNEFRCVA